MKKKTRTIWRPQKAIIETTTKKGKQRFLTIMRPLVKTVDFTKNPESFTVASIPRIMTAKIYANEPEKVVIYFETDNWTVNVSRVRDFVSFYSKIFWYLGAFGKISKNAKLLRQRCSYVTIRSMKRKAKQRYGEPENAT